MKYTLPLLLLFLVGCTPRLLAPQVVVPERYLYGASFSQDSIDIDERWLRIFGDSTLNALVEHALEQNKELKIAISRIEQARFNLAVARSAYLPSLGAEISANGEYTSANQDIAQTYKITPTVSWEIPLFGSLRHATRKAKANILYEEWQWRGVQLSLEAEVATAYFTLLQYRQDLNIARRSSELRREMVSLIDSLFHYGFASGSNLEQAKSLLYTAEVDIPRYEYAISQTILSLSTLLGEEPAKLAPLCDSKLLPQLQEPQLYRTAVGVPSDLLLRRPDMLSAYCTLQAAAADVGIARMARLPSFSLTLFGGSDTDKVGNLFSGGAWVANALLAISQPIYNFGGLRRGELAAKEAYRQSVLSYEQTFIEALADVENALANITSSRQELDQYNSLVNSYYNIAQTSYALYINGLSNYLDVIDAERSLYTSQMERANLVAQQYINLINLYKALGGGN